MTIIPQILTPRRLLTHAYIAVHTKNSMIKMAISPLRTVDEGISCITFEHTGEQNEGGGKTDCTVTISIIKSEYGTSKTTLTYDRSTSNYNIVEYFPKYSSQFFGRLFFRRFKKNKKSNGAFLRSAIIIWSRHYLCMFITHPGLQYPHCVPLKAASRLCMGWYPSFWLPMPSTVVMLHPWQERTDTRH